MEVWIQQVFTAPEFNVLVLPAGFLFGLITSLACLGCCAPIIAAVIGYAGSRENERRRDIFVIAGSFMLGTVLALSAAGLLVGYIGQAASSTFGLYGKIFMAAVVIFLGFATLNILPFKLSSINITQSKLPGGLTGAALFGLAVGTASTAYTMGCCGPVLLPVVLGLSMLKGQPGWGALILALFAVGYSLPLVAVILGVGVGKLAIFSSKITEPIRIVSGIVLIAAGLWLLFTL